MITRFALFEGTVAKDRVAEFRQAVLDRLVPVWTTFPGHVDVQVTFSDDRDPGAPEFPLILGISYPDLATMNAAIDSPQRLKSKEVTEAIVEEFFTGRIHHHVTDANRY